MFIKDYYETLIIYVKKKIKLIVNNDFEIAKKFKFNGIHLGEKIKLAEKLKKNLVKILL